VIAQCGAVVRLRATHPHRVRPSRLLPVPLLIFPVSIAAAVLAASPARNWLSAALLLGATALLYALIHITRCMQGHKLGAPPSARAAAAAEALQVVVPPYGPDADPAEMEAADSEAAELTRVRRPTRGIDAADGGPGDAWFGRLVESYRQVPNREAVATEVVQAFEMTALEASEWSRDLDRPGSRAPPYDSDDDAADGELRRPAVRAPSLEPSPVAAAAGSGGAEEVSASEAAGALAAERESMTASSSGAKPPPEEGGFVDIIE
jgi:hypothetical protein